MKHIFYSLLLLLFFSEFSFSQDTHYWTQQFGSRSSLLGGSVVGGVRDNSAVFYNPGGLAFVDSSNISVSADGYQYDMLKLTDGAGKGIDLQSSYPQIIPLIITGLQKFKDYPRHTLGYALMQRHQSNFEMSARNDSKLNVVNDPASNKQDQYISQFIMNTSLSEIWGGGSYSFKINKHIGLGVSVFGAYRTQTMDHTFVGRVIPDSSFQQTWINSDTAILENIGTLISANDIENIYFSNVRLLGKIGLNFDFDNLKFGITITTPSLNTGILSSAIIGRDITLNNLKLFADDPSRFNITGNDRQEDLPTIYKSPMSVSFGFEYKIAKTAICGTVEWFDKLDFYDWATPESKAFLRFAGIDFNSKDMLKIREGSKSVVNFAFGIEQGITKKFSLLASYRTNKSYYNMDTVGIPMSFTNWNLTHFTLGGIFKSKKSDFSFGVSYAYASKDDFDQLINLKDPKESEFLQGVLGKSSMTFNSVALILGYTYYIK